MNFKKPMNTLYVGEIIYVPSLKTKAENENTKKDEEKRKNDIGG